MRAKHWLDGFRVLVAVAVAFGAPAGARDRVLPEPRVFGTADFAPGARIGLEDNRSFVPSATARAAREPFRGTLRLTEVRLETEPADLGLHAVLGKDPQYFPRVDLAFTTVDGDLVPATEEVVRSGSLAGGKSYWDVIVQPGRVWTEPGDDGWSRAAFPFALVQSQEGETHNGLATFRYRSGEVSALRFQIVQQTTPGHIETYFTAAGLVPATIGPAPSIDWGAIGAEHRAARRDAVPVRDWKELAARVGPARLAGFADGLSAAQTVLTGLDYRGTFYMSGCASAAGPLPWCERIRFGVWSVTKSFANEVALLRLAQKFGPEVFEAKISDYVPAVAKYPAWSRVRFEDCINMATGIGNGSARREPNDAGDGYIDATYNEWADARSEADKVAALLRIARVYPWGPGEVVRYRDQDMYVLGVAMQAYLRSKEGPGADLWTMLEKEVYAPIGIHHAPINRTLETDGSRGYPILPYGYYGTVGDLVKVARLYHARGRHHGQQILYAPRIERILTGAASRGLPTGSRSADGETTYYNSFWNLRYDASEGCRLYIPQMIGWGDNLVALFPGGLTGIRIAHNRPDDSAEQGDNLAMARVANRLTPFCR
jgi:Beta-lactamase